MGKQTIEEMEQARYERALIVDALLLVVMVMLGLGAAATLLVGVLTV